MENARRAFGNSIEYSDSVEGCLKGSSCALIVTEWDEFKELKPEHFISLMKIPAVVDGRRIYDPKLFSHKLRFAAIGLGEKECHDPLRTNYNERRW